MHHLLPRVSLHLQRTATPPSLTFCTIARMQRATAPDQRHHPPSSGNETQNQRPPLTHSAVPPVRASFHSYESR
ncbi:hypothetical protein DEO72_LG3g1231 [Vigna unguiculata]|uniref:Uncharacterized protein n=1 Tax=Vigna unguiculata TaxID=3917 RepID=A0A4D6LE66_VIGUN|nr:hypothetical protein DEO72_LG3g1231 [Vigna unguiculata]